MDIGECGPAVFAINQCHSVGIDTQVRSQHTVQGSAALGVPVGQMPDVNLVIAQVLCYVGKRRCVRCDHPRMVPLAMPLHKHAREASRRSAWALALCR